MKLPKPEETNFEKAPAGSHIAVCYRVIDLGTQTRTWEGSEKQVRELMLGWEIQGEAMESGERFAIHERYTFSSAKKANLRKVLESWRGQPFTDEDFADGGFDVSKLLGAPCMLTVIHKESNGKVYANVQSVAKLMKGVEVKDLQQPKQYFCFDGAPDLSVFTNLPDYWKDMIAASPEWKALRDEDPETEPAF